MYIEKIILKSLSLKNVILQDKSLKNIGIPLRYRPDVVMYFPSKMHYIVLEIDERQHNGYDIQKEYARYLNINKELKRLGTVKWIRFNPDGYRSPKPKVALCKRLKMLKSEIYKSKKNPRNDITHMFYSCNNKHKLLL